MVILELILVFMIQFEGISGRDIYLYHGAGDDVVLPCLSGLTANYCKYVYWAYQRGEQSAEQYEVKLGEVSSGSLRAERLSLTSSCSLNIKNITAEDAGCFNCKLDLNTVEDQTVYLNILTVSQVPPHSDPAKDGEVTLNCSMSKYQNHPCSSDSLRWVGESGRNLPDEHLPSEHDSLNCVSSLIVEHQRGKKKSFICRFFEEGTVQKEVRHTVAFSDPIPNHTSVIIIVPVVLAALLLVVAAAVVMRCRKSSEVPECQTNITDAEDLYHNYNQKVLFSTCLHTEDKTFKHSLPRFLHSLCKLDVNILHSEQDEIQPRDMFSTAQLPTPKTAHEMKVKENEEVVFCSAVKDKTESGISPSTLYSCISKPQ